jgi:hypothetical protein
VPVNPAGLAKHYLTPALAALGLAHTRWYDLRHAFAVMSLSAGEHYMARGHAAKRFSSDVAQHGDRVIGIL